MKNMLKKSGIVAALFLSTSYTMSAMEIGTASNKCVAGTAKKFESSSLSIHPQLAEYDKQFGNALGSFCALFPKDKQQNIKIRLGLAFLVDDQKCIRQSIASVTFDLAKAVSWSDYKKGFAHIETMLKAHKVLREERARY